MPPRPATSAPAPEQSIDPEEFLARMRATKAAEAKAAAKAEVSELSGYNQYSRPKVRPRAYTMLLFGAHPLLSLLSQVSSTIPLRSSFLDPRVNNIPKSKTRCVRISPPDRASEASAK